MGVSTDAILFYGWEYGGEDEETLPEDVVDMGWNSPGIDVGCHCCDAEPVSYISAYTIVAWRGKCLDVPDLNSFSKEEMNARLKEFCQKASIKYKEPAWRLVSWWG